MSVGSKRVHFASSPSTIHQYTPIDAPSPSWSDLSLSDDESGPSTPPSTSSFANHPLYDDPKKAHTFEACPLIFDSRTRTSPLDWDVRQRPSYVERRPTLGKSKGASRLLPSDLYQPATTSAETSMTIKIAQLPQFWRPIEISHDGSPSHPVIPITVGEVIDAVYQYMLIPVSQEEYSFFPHDIQRATSKAYWRRHDSAKQAGNVQLLAAVERGGMRRMDVLGIKTKFIALLPDSDRSSWTIVLAPSNS